jgi:ribosomal protein S18 acetylase RimI-like enzyme
MENIQPRIRRGTLADAETLTPLAIEIFNDAFADHPLNKPEDMKAYIEEAFSLEQWRREFADPETVVFIAETGGQMAGYAKLREHSTEKCVSDRDPIELQRLYVAKEFHGRGIAASLLNECFEEARRRNFRTIWLGVWEHNHRAQRFYQKHGFEKVGTHIFQLGSDAQTDWVMERKL